VRALIKDLGGDRTVLLSTHILSEVEATCERAIVIDRGRLVAEGRIEELRARKSSTALSVRVRDANAGAEAVIGRISGLSVSQVSADAVDVTRRTLQLTLAAELEPDATVELLVRALTEAGIGIHALIPEQASLEQVFSELTAHEKAEARAQTPGGER
jgi:ABC-2 type transport system ATP-binding protein